MRHKYIDIEDWLVPSIRGGDDRNGTHKLRVLHVGKFYPPHMGGIETHLQALCTQLCKTLDVRVLVANDAAESAEHIIEGVAVSRMGTPLTLFSAPLCPTASLRINRADAGLVHIH